VLVVNLFLLEILLLFPAVNKHTTWIIAGIALGTVMAVAIFAIIAFYQSNELSALVVTATPTKTSAKRATSTATTPPTGTPTNPPTSTNTATPTPTKTSTNTPTPTLLPPTLTFTPESVIIATPTATPVILVEPTISGTLELSLTVTLTATEVITPAGTPTPTPTPVPRTIKVPGDIPDYAGAQNHFWFTRAFTETSRTWGSYYYPYGTNAQGQYFWHYGIDIENPQSTTIIATGDGTVTHAGADDETLLGPWLGFYGQAVVIEADQRWQDQPVYTLYGHVSKVLVQQGQRVQTGDPIAEVGQLGVATGPHLHLEVRIGSATYDDTRNPDLWLRSDPGHGVIAGRVVDSQGYYVPQQLVTLHRAEAPGRFWRQTFSYPDNEVNSDEGYFETFAFSDVPVGNYLLKTFFDGRQLTVPITVTNGATSFGLLQQTETLSLSTESVPQPSPTIVDSSSNK
jgi:murein DD-endopeptidase MepM/ murein hydrolase activator NlpD